jgi:SAM-dependent methyltransferase
MAIWVSRQQWLASGARYWWPQELVRDIAETDVHALHRFLWGHHLGYAQSYEAPRRFGRANIEPWGRKFFSDLVDQAANLDALGAQGVRSVFEVGCSLGYLLRFMETDVFPAATEFGGIDIDGYAVKSGSQYLEAVGSRISLQCSDMRELERLLGGKEYDVMICPGVLSYLNEAAAGQAVATMLRHSKLVALTGLANPGIDNALLPHSDVRRSDMSFIHNLDRMVTNGGGHVTGRRWEDDRDFDTRGIYFVFATDGALSGGRTDLVS